MSPAATGAGDPAGPPGDSPGPPGDPPPVPARASVVVITMCRPDFLRTCLEHLERQTVPPAEVIVVDASADDVSERMVAGEFPATVYLRNPKGAGAMATSRNIGLGSATGDVVAFVDDDAFAAPDWLEHLLVPYADPAVGAVGGRVLRGDPPPWTEDLEIGRMHSDGTFTGNFDADPGRVVEVDHVQGANMSYRRRVLGSLGGIRDGYPGTCVREETDLCCRVRAAGHRVLFAPGAVVDHVAAPYVRGRRFDLRYQYYAQRNHVVLLIRNFGFASPVHRRYLAFSVHRVGEETARLRQGRRQGRSARALARSAAGVAARAVVVAAGTAAGTAAGLVERRRDRRPPGFR